MPQASCAITLEPFAVAKAKRLGRDLSIKLTLQPPPGSSGGSNGSSVRLVGCGEDYVISWPSMVFLDPISPACKLAYKGGGLPLPALPAGLVRLICLNNALLPQLVACGIAATD